MMKSEKEPRMYWHWQNLDEDRDGRPLGSGLRHGRGWLRIDRTQFRVEWKVPSRMFGLGLRISTDSDDTLRIQACVPPVTLFFGLESWALNRALAKLVEAHALKGEFDWGGYSRDLSMSVHDWGIYWNLWRNPHGSRGRDWRSSAWHPFGFPGSRIGELEVRETREVVVPMPERSYRATATRSVGYSRGTQRWPFGRKRFSSVSIDFLKGEQLPIPGKGENSWDCDEDAFFGSSVGAETIEEAIGELVESALRRRRRYGGANWTPKAKAAAE